MARQFLKNCMSVPFVLDIVALVDVSTFEPSTFVVLAKVIGLFDTNPKDQANVTGLSFACSGKRCKLPGLHNIVPIEAALFV